jgi:hypothetical protein
MQVTRESIKQEIDRFNDSQLKQIAEFIEFIKFRNQFQSKIIDVNQFASLYQEFAQDDRELAELGIEDYAELLQREEQS